MSDVISTDYLPSQCYKCKKVSEDCSNLPFTDMPVVEEHSRHNHKVVFVNCYHFEEDLMVVNNGKVHW